MKVESLILEPDGYEYTVTLYKEQLYYGVAPQYWGRTAFRDRVLLPFNWLLVNAKDLDGRA
jgi:hypothetical protein